MKLLVFAHSPPPHHGQSYMVQLMLDRLGGDQRQKPHPTNPDYGIRCYHVNVRLSKQLSDIGEFRLGKFVLLILYCLEAIWCRFRYNVPNFYYIPAPGKRSALYRDWLVMLLCRPFFRCLIVHWHASGLAKWLETHTNMRFRELTYGGFRGADLSIVLSNYGRADAEKFLPKRVAVVGNGIPDPCPGFLEKVLPRRKARHAARLRLLGKVGVALEADAAGKDRHIVEVLFLGHCTQEKGLFEAVQGAIEAEKDLTRMASPFKLRLTVAGSFVRPEDEQEFRSLAAAHPDLIHYVGFVTGADKERLLIESDVFCFPSHIESFGLVLVEAMAYGLPIVTARAGAVPEVMSPDYAGLVDVKSPSQVAAAIQRMMLADDFEALRDRFTQNFTLDRHIERLASTLSSLSPQTKE